jgi:hypothetical protein
MVPGNTPVLDPYNAVVNNMVTQKVIFVVSSQ